MVMSSIGSVSLVEEALRNGSDHVASMAVEMGLVNTDVERAECECCGLAEDCTPAYIAHVRGVYGGRWICGLCAEAIKEEHRRAGGGANQGLEGAVRAHMYVCMQFNSSGRVGSPVGDIVRKLLRRHTSVGFTFRSAPSSPQRSPSISRANSCFGALPQGS